MSEQLPISEKLKVVQSFTIHRTDKWWSAVALIESFGRKQVAVYLWTRKGDEWKRKQKMTIHSKSEWPRLKEAIEKLIESLP
jgi:hypothetical protein